MDRMQEGGWNKASGRREEGRGQGEWISKGGKKRSEEEVEERRKKNFLNFSSFFICAFSIIFIIVTYQNAHEQKTRRSEMKETGKY